VQGAMLDDVDRKLCRTWCVALPNDSSHGIGGQACSLVEAHHAKYDNNRYSHSRVMSRVLLG
jgi:hypothetical protein